MDCFASFISWFNLISTIIALPVFIWCIFYMTSILDLDPVYLEAVDPSEKNDAIKARGLSIGMIIICLYDIVVSVYCLLDEEEDALAGLIIGKMVPGCPIGVALLVYQSKIISRYNGDTIDGIAPMSNYITSRYTADVYSMMLMRDIDVSNNDLNQSKIFQSGIEKYMQKRYDYIYPRSAAIISLEQLYFLITVYPPIVALACCILFLAALFSK